MSPPGFGKKAGPNWALIGGIAAAAVVVGAVVFFLMRGRGGSEIPPITADTKTLVGFVNSAKFEKLEFGVQLPFLKVMDDRDKDVHTLLKEGKITESEYNACRVAGWAGKVVDRAEKYQRSGPAEKLKMLRDHYKKDQKDKKPDSPAADHPKGSKGSKGPKEKEPKPDDTAKDAWVARFTPDIKAKYDKYEKDYDDHKRIEKDKEKAVKAAAAAAATKPAPK